MSEIKTLFRDEGHYYECHSRWIEQRNNWHPNMKEEDTPDEWYDQQCGSCQFFVPLSGSFKSDYGVCSNAQSPFDRTAMFEHDGCIHFAPSNTWVSDEVD